VADAKNLRRALELTIQLAEFGFPIVLALNMWDEAGARGINIDVKLLSELLAIPVVCALKRGDENNRSVRTEPREGLWCAQTPQMFRYSVLREAYARPGFEHCVDETQAVEALGARPRLVAGNSNNLKVSYPEDLRLAAAILAAERGAKT
jgi:2-C-methyl-D-erythritol 4-phosphate cytidylyltransferase